MNLVQKLPIGLSLACVMFMSSCSKEDIQTPEPQMESVNAHSNAKEGPGPVVISVGAFPSTDGPTGFNVYPQNWKRYDYKFFSNDQQAFPIGTSSLNYLWGNNSISWLKPLSGLPLAQNSNSMITTTTGTSSYESNKKAGVTTQIKNLVPFKTYTITFYVASTIPKLQSAAVLAYAKTAHIAVGSTQFGGNSSSQAFEVDLAGSNANWIEKTITFKTLGTEATFMFYGLTAQEGQFSYLHLYVDKNSIKKVN